MCCVCSKNVCVCARARARACVHMCACMLQQVNDVKITFTYKKVKQSHYNPGQALRVPGG